MLLSQYLISAVSILVTPFTVIAIALLVEAYHDFIKKVEA